MKSPKPPDKDYVDVTDTIASDWLVGLIYSHSGAFEYSRRVWVDLRVIISIKPGETGRQAYKRRFEQELPKHQIVFHNDR